jgi:hypothetical protein
MAVIPRAREHNLTSSGKNSDSGSLVDEFANVGSDQPADRRFWWQWRRRAQAVGLRSR